MRNGTDDAEDSVPKFPLTPYAIWPQLEMQKDFNQSNYFGSDVEVRLILNMLHPNTFKPLAQQDSTKNLHYKRRFLEVSNILSVVYHHIVSSTYY